MSDPGLPSQRSPLLRPVAIGAVCVAAVVGGVLWLNPSPRQDIPTPPVQATPPQATPPQQVVAAPPPAPPPAAIAAVAPPPPARPAAGPAPVAAPAPVAKPAEPAAEPTKPSFDIVRVNPQGNAVIAGRAAPGAQVSVADNGKVIGKTEADAQGQWVILPTAPIAPGGSELTVAAATADQQPVKGDAPVVVLIPDQPKAPDKPKPGEAPAKVATAAPVTPVAPVEPVAPVAPVAVLTPNDAAPRLLQPPPAAPSAGALGLGTVDYTDHGDIRFAGSAPPGATVRTYVDNQPAGDAAADAQGHWALVPEAKVAVGDHQLRLDQVGQDGHVIKRVELPFERADVSAQQVADGHIVVQPGQNLWRIARHAYGRGIQYVVIYQANRSQIRDPNLIYPGQAFAVPTPDAARGSAAMPPSSSTSR